MIVSRTGFGVDASLDPDAVVGLAIDAERLGYHSFWVNQPNGSLRVNLLARVVKSTRSIRLGIGVIPISDFPLDQIARALEDADLPVGRVTIGLGSGSLSDPGQVGRALASLRNRVPCEWAIGAMGPKMCRLAGAEADAVLLNWVTPKHAEVSRRWTSEGAATAGKPLGKVYAYVRASFGPDAAEILANAVEVYKRYPGYGTHLARERRGDAIGIAVRSVDRVWADLNRWRGPVDEPIVRGLGSPDDLMRLLAVARSWSI